MNLLKLHTYTVFSDTDVSHFPLPAASLLMSVMQCSDYMEEPASRRKERETLFTEMIKRYSAVITRICYSFAHDEDTFNDMRQDTLINIWKGVEGFRNASSPETWIYRVALNTCVSYLRRSSCHAPVLTLESVKEPASEKKTDSDLSDLLHEQIARLPAEDKALILLWLDGFAYAEIAEIVGMPRNTVATRLKRVKEKLAEANRHQ